MDNEMDYLDEAKLLLSPEMLEYEAPVNIGSSYPEARNAYVFQAIAHALVALVERLDMMTETALLEDGQMGAPGLRIHRW